MVHTLGEIRGTAVAAPVGPASPETPGRRLSCWGSPPEMRRAPGLSQGRAQALAPGELPPMIHHEVSLFVVCACIYVSIPATLHVLWAVW